MSLRKIAYFLLLTFGFLVLTNCSGEPDKKPTEKPKKTAVKKKPAEKKAAAPKKKERRFPKLNAKNAETFLLDFGKKNKEQKVRISTDFGNIDLLLYNSTPLHRSNFVYLIKQQFFDNTVFYRVSENFVVQGGDSDDSDFQDVKKEIGN